jgi:CheY-like chemotaxis protein
MPFSLLIVEDEEDYRESLIEIIGNELDIQIATTYQEAVRILSGNPPFDAILLDKQLPDGDGLNHIADIREFGDKTLIMVHSANFIPTQPWDTGAFARVFCLEKHGNLNVIKQQIMDLLDQHSG